MSARKKPCSCLKDRQRLVQASLALQRAAREYAAAEILSPFTALGRAKLEEAALAYAQAMTGTKRVRRTSR